MVRDTGTATAPYQQLVGPWAGSLIVEDEDTMSVQSTALSSHAQPAWTDAALEQVIAYARWYKTFVHQYERDLENAGETDPEGLAYAYRYGLSKLEQFKSALHVENQADADALRDVLLGFRLLAELATDLDSRAVMIITLVMDAAEQLKDLGLIIHDDSQQTSLSPASPQARRASQSQPLNAKPTMAKVSIRRNDTAAHPGFAIAA